MTVWKIKL